MGQGHSPVSILLSLASEGTHALEEGPPGLTKSWQMRSKAKQQRNALVQRGWEPARLRTRGKATPTAAKALPLSCINKQHGPFLLDPLLVVFAHTHARACTLTHKCTHTNHFISSKKNNQERSTQFVFATCGGFFFFLLNHIWLGVKTSTFGQNTLKTKA